MNDMPDMNNDQELRRLTLQRGLDAFDRAVAAKRLRGRVARGSVAVITVAALAFAATRFGAAPPAINQPQIASRPLPSYVQVIRDDAQLTLELALASACERIGRAGGRIYVAECTRP
ncbi:MAG: hypothetical protein SGJ11_06615 [Phycisphaerae bacterium]|nr:hypothetical protein [Phycisphaerae bacterium]